MQNKVIYLGKQSIYATVAKAKSLKMQMKALESQYKALEKDIKGYMADRDELTNTDGEQVLTYKYEKRMEFDKKAFKEDHGDIYELYSKPKTLRKLLLK